MRLPRLDRENAQRIENAAFPDAQLSGLPGIEPQPPREGTKTVYYNYVIRYSQADLGVPRKDFVAALKAEGIPVPGDGLIYYPLYRDPVFKRLDPYGKGCPFTCPYYDAPDAQKPRYEDGSCPVTERMCDHVNIEIKIHPPAAAADMPDIAAAFKKVVDNIEELKA